MRAVALALLLSGCALVETRDDVDVLVNGNVEATVTCTVETKRGQ